LDALPQRIAALEDEQRTLEARASSADFYKEGAEAIRSVLARLEAIGHESHVAYERWLELESRAAQ
jgi:ATP-binding cassette subfamily F protein uup